MGKFSRFASKGLKAASRGYAKKKVDYLVPVFLFIFFYGFQQAFPFGVEFPI